MIKKQGSFQLSTSSSSMVSSVNSKASGSKSSHHHEKVVVHIRLRPPNDNEYGSGNAIEVFDTQRRVMQIKKDTGEKRNFQFDSLLEPGIGQGDVFDQVAVPVINGVIEGFNGTIFAYGQTGTGKTHTMVGNYHPLSNEQRGIIPRSLQYLFDQIKQCKEGSNKYSFDVSCAFVQIYMEMVQDLINPSQDSSQIKIREDPLQGVFVQGLQWVPIKSTKQGMQAFSVGEKNRATSFTKMNAHSSRSHAVFMVKVEKRQMFKLQNMAGTADPDEDIPADSMTQSMLYLVDLAGSERVKKSQVSAHRLDEAKKINFSLAALGNCIHALTDSKKQSHVPFRDSKLTRILSDSLGGNSKTALVVTIGPAKDNSEESVMSLQFAQRAMRVENAPVINKKIDFRILNLQLQSELDDVNDQLTKLQIKYMQALEQIDLLTQENLELKTNGATIKSSAATTPGDDSKVKQIQQAYEEILKKKEQEYQKLMQDVDQLMSQREQQIETLKQSLQQSKGDLADVTQQFTQQEREKSDLEARIIEIGGNLEKSRHKESKLKHICEQFKQQLESAQHLRQQAITAYEQLKLQNTQEKSDFLSTIDQLTKELDQLQLSCNEQKQLTASYQGNLQQLNQQLKTLQSQNQQMVVRNQELEVQAQESAELMQRQAKVGQEVEKRNQQLKQTLEAQREQYDKELESLMQDIQQARTKQESEKTVLQNNLANLTKTLNEKELSFNNTLKDKDSQIQRIIQDNNTLINEYEAKLQQQTSLIQKQNNDIQSLQTQLRNDQLGYQQSISDLNNKHQTTIEQANKEHNELIQMINLDHQQQLQQLTSNLTADAQDRESTYQKQLNEIKENNTKQSQQIAKEYEIKLKKASEEFIQQNEALRNQLEQVQESKLQEQKKQYEDKLLSIQTQYQLTLQEHQLQIKNIEDKHKSQLESLKDQYDKEIMQLNDSFQQQISNQTGVQSQKLQEMQNQSKQELQSLQSQHSQDLQTQQQKYEKEQVDLKRIHSLEFDQLIQSHNSQIKELTNSHAEQLKQVQSTLSGDMSKVITQYEERLKTNKDNYELQITELQATNQEKIKHLENQFVQESARLKQIQEDQIGALNKSNENEINQAKKRHEEELQKLIIDHEQEKRSLVEQFQKKSEIIAMDNDSKIMELICQQENEIVNLNSKHEQELKQIQANSLTAENKHLQRLDELECQSQQKISSLNEHIQCLISTHQQEVLKLNSEHQLSLKAKQFECIDLHTQYTEISSELAVLKTENSELTLQNSILSTQLLDYTNQNNILSQQSVDLNNQIASLSDQVQLLSSMNIDSEQTFKEQYENMQREAQLQKTVLQERVHQKEKALQEKFEEIQKLEVKEQEKDEKLIQYELRYQALQGQLLALNQKELPDLREGLSHYLMESLKYQAERQILRDNLMSYDKQIKDKREQIASFTTNFIAIYTPDSVTSEGVGEVMDTMLLYLELREGFDCTQKVQISKQWVPKVPFQHLPAQKLRSAPKISLQSIVNEQSKFNKQSFAYQQLLLNLCQYAFMTISQSEEREFTLLQQLNKTKTRLTTVLKAFDDHKRKSQLTSVYDQAARKIQRFWRQRIQYRLEREWNRVTHKYVQERLHAKEAQWQLEEGQASIGRSLIKESMKHAGFAMEGLLRAFVAPSNSLDHKLAKHNILPGVGSSSMSSLKQALAQKLLNPQHQQQNSSSSNTTVMTTQMMNQCSPQRTMQHSLSTSSKKSSL